MVMDYGSVLMAVGAAGAALCFTLFTTWLKQRESGYLAVWSVTMAILVATAITFGIYGAGGPDVFGLAAGLMLVTAFCLSLSGTEQFASGRFPAAATIALTFLTNAAVTVPFLFGMDGLGFVLINGFSAALIGVSGYIFWTLRAESRWTYATLAMVHFAVAASFALCSAVIALNSPLYLDGPPDNWSELVNLITCVIGITAVGGLLVTVHQERIARALRHAAITDALTGVLNRRAVYDRFVDGEVPSETAMVVFDLDDFKGVNDRHGHSFGDIVLQRFAALMHETVGEAGLCARLGGEEFTVILPDTGPHQARALAEMVRMRFGQMRFASGEAQVGCTVSAGVAISGPRGCSLDKLMRQADSALYVSKRNGRNQVTYHASRRAA